MTGCRESGERQKGQRYAVIIQLLMATRCSPTRLFCLSRALFCRDNDDRSTATPSATIIPLNNAREIIAWVQFAGHDLDRMKLEDSRDTAQFRELLFVLGEKLNDDGDSTTVLRLAPGAPISRETHCHSYTRPSIHPSLRFAFFFFLTVQTTSARYFSYPRRSRCALPSTPSSLLRSTPRPMRSSRLRVSKV